MSECFGHKKRPLLAGFRDIVLIFYLVEPSTSRDRVSHTAILDRTSLLVVEKRRLPSTNILIPGLVRIPIQARVSIREDTECINVRTCKRNFVSRKVCWGVS